MPKFLAAIDLAQNELQNAKIQNLASPPSSPVMGLAYYDTGLKQFGVYSGTAWQYLPATPIPIANGGTGQTTQQAAINALTGTQSAGKYLRSDGTNASLTSIVAGDVPTLNQNTTGTASNITGTLDQVPAPAANVSLNSKKIISLANGTAATDAAAYGQTPAGGNTVTIGQGGTGATTQQGALDAIAGAVANNQVLAGNGTHVTLRALAAADLPAATGAAQGAVQLAGDLGGTAASPQVVGTHLASALPINQGGTAATTAAGAITNLGAVDTSSTQSIGGTKTFTGEIVVPAPVNPGDAVTKAYADAIAQGLSVKPSARVATTGSETYTVSSGNVTQISGTTIDGVSPAVGDRILIKDAPAATGAGSAFSSQPGNGTYTVTSNTTNLSVSRATDMSGSNAPQGAFVFTEAGTANTGAGFVVTTPSAAGAFTYGTGSIQWTQFSGTGEITAGTGLSKSGNTISLLNPVTIALGGTGAATQQAAINALTGTQSAGKYLRSDGTNASLAAIVAGDVPTLNQNTTGTASNITGTLDQVPAPAANVSLNSKKIISLGNGTSASDAAALGQTVTGILTTLGDLIYENATPAPVRLPGNTSATKNFLTQTGNGSVSAAPAWGTIAAGDLPTATTSTQGAVIIDGTAGDIKPTSTAAAAGSKGQAADASHVHVQNWLGFFGDVSDGAVTFDGSSTVLGMVPSSNTYTMTRDIFCTNVTVNNGVTLQPNGWLIFCQGTFTDNTGSTLTVAGGNGFAAGGGGGVGGGSNRVSSGKAGGGGQTGVGTGGTSTNGAGLNTAGNSGTGTSGAGGAGGTAGASGNSWFKSPAVALTGLANVAGTTSGVTGGPGGGGGGGDTTNKGGGGGGGGGVLVIFAWAIVHNGTYNASGGAGGTPTAGNTGGGGGGSGGLILTYSLTAPTGSGTNNVSGGAAGSPHGTGTNNATAGGSGTILNQVLS